MSDFDGGKGSKRRPEDKKQVDANWDLIFNKKKKGKKDASKTKTKSKDKK